MALDFDYHAERLAPGSSCSTVDLIEWIGQLHGALANAGALPAELDTVLHQELMILARLADELECLKRL